VAGLVTGRLMGWASPFDGAAAAAAAAASTPQPPAFSIRAHADPCRALAFSRDGTALYSTCAAGSLVVMDVAAGRLCGRLVSACPDAPITRLAPAGGGAGEGGGALPPLSFLAGDEAGGLTLWDPRSVTPAVVVAGAHDGDVTALLASPGAHATTAVSAGGDGVLAVTDLRKGAVAARSDPDEDELLALAVARGGRKLVSGSAGGVVGLWSWGFWGGVSDRWPLPRAGTGKAAARPSVEALAHLPGVSGAPDALLAACGDGALRTLGVLPTGVVGCVDAAHGGRAGAKATRPLEGVAVGNVGGGGGGPPLVVTMAMACRELRAWDGGALAAAAGGVAASAKKRKQRKGGGGESRSEDEEDGEEDDEEDAAPPPPARKAAKGGGGGGANFFADLL
jgi:WD repeat-containing protein 55